MAVTVGSVRLPNPVMTASGTAGHGAELAPYVDLGALGAVVVKSLHAEPWAGNPPLRVHETPAGMLNSVGLQGPGVRAWLTDHLPGLLATGARVVASIWGRTVDEYRRAAEMLADAPPEVVAVEVNLSCPNTEAGRDLFAHSAEATAAAVAATAACGRPRWAKLSPNVGDIAEIAVAAHGAGAEAVTPVKTARGRASNPGARRFPLGPGPRGGGLPGPAPPPPPAPFRGWGPPLPGPPPPVRPSVRIPPAVRTPPARRTASRSARAGAPRWRTGGAAPARARRRGTSRRKRRCLRR
nr:dihydroorotate dehydrogenase [Thermoanaerobacterales bacterium]